MLDKKQKEWVGKVSKTLGIAEMGEQDEAKQQYAETLKLLTPRFKNTLSHDKEGILGGKINTAVKFAQSGSYIDAQNTLDDAGQYATQLISANLETHEGSGELIGKALPDKYKNEQFQKDKEGKVMHGGEFRANSKNRTNYYTDEERKKSVVRTDDQGRLVDSEGKFLQKDRGFVVSKDEGTLHSFDLSEEQKKDGYTVYTHHSSPIQGGSAAAAGEMMTEDGVLRKVTDQSGHTGRPPR